MAHRARRRSARSDPVDRTADPRRARSSRRSSSSSRDKRIVMIGEATPRHARVLQHARRAHAPADRRAGFAAVAVEGDWPDALRVDRYVRGHGDDDSADEALAAFERFPRWMWRNARRRGVRRLAARATTTQRPSASASASTASISTRCTRRCRRCMHYLEDSDPDGGARARASATPASITSAATRSSTARRRTSASATTARPRSSRSSSRCSVRKLARSGRAPTGDAWFHAVQQAHVVRNAEAYYRTMFARPQRVVEPARHAHGRHDRHRSRITSATARPRKIDRVGAQLARRRCARDRDGRRRPGHARPARTAAPSRARSRSSASRPTTAR